MIVPVNGRTRTVRLHQLHWADRFVYGGGKDLHRPVALIKTRGYCDGVDLAEVFKVANSGDGDQHWTDHPAVTLIAWSRSSDGDGAGFTPMEQATKRMRSMTVGDIVEVFDTNVSEAGMMESPLEAGHQRYFRCERSGWTEVNGTLGIDPDDM
jgi:hypothetical protein